MAIYIIIYYIYYEQYGALSTLYLLYPLELTEQNAVLCVSLATKIAGQHISAWRSGSDLAD